MPDSQRLIDCSDLYSERLRLAKRMTFDDWLKKHIDTDAMYEECEEPFDCEFQECECLLQLKAEYETQATWEDEKLLTSFYQKRLEDWERIVCKKNIQEVSNGKNEA